MPNVLTTDTSGFAITHNRPLDDEVESDEMFVGGKEKNQHARKRTFGKQDGKGKIAVLGTPRALGQT